jgi:iron complex outermembrane receptor protein
MYRIVLFAVGFFAFNSSFIAQAQESSGKAAEISAPAPETQATPAPPLETSGQVSGQEKVERIEVTGSHIKRIDVEGVSPVVTVTRKDIEKTGYNAIADVIRDLSVNSFGSARETSGSNAAGVAEVDLRGLGSSNTLVLLNGQRLPSDAVSGAVDLNLIPMAAVERIEILKDGASAIYGSDALGGVVNIITRKDFKGSQVSMTQTLPEMKGGAKSEISLVNGVNSENFNMVNVLQYRDNKVVYSRDRFWDNNVSLSGSPGSYQNAGAKWHADPNCPASQIVHQPNGDFCGFTTSDYSTQLPALQQLGLLSEMNLQATSKLKFVARLGGTQKKVQWSYAPSPGNFKIPASVAGTLGPGGTSLPGTTAGQDLLVKYRLSDLGTRDQEVNTLAYNVLLGGTYEVAPDWNVEVNASHNKVDTKDNGVNGYALQAALDSAIASGKYNPFATGSAKGSIDNTRYNPYEHQISQLSGVEIKSSGELAKWEAGPLGLAVGGNFFFEKFEDNADDQTIANKVFGNSGSSGGGQRDTRSAYSELSIPLLKSLELQLAARYDHYSDFGDTANPKAAVLYHASPSVLIRGSVGTGFKAPRMQDLYAASSSGFPTFIDAVACSAEKKAGGATPSCLPQQYEVDSSGNSGLREEKSLSYNAGVTYEPTSNFSIGTDWFLTLLKNVVGIDYNDAIVAQQNGTNLAQYGVIVNRDPNGYISNIVAPLQNLTSQEVSGIDVSVMYKPINRWKLSTDHSQLFYFKEEGFPGAGGRDKLGENGRPNWRNTTAVSYTLNENNEFSLAGLTTAGQLKAVKENGRMPNYTTFDFNYAFKSKNYGTFSAGIRNVLGSTPPLDDSSPSSQLNDAIYDQIGRQLIAGYKVNF